MDRLRVRRPRQEEPSKLVTPTNSLAVMRQLVTKGRSSGEQRSPGVRRSQWIDKLAHLQNLTWGRPRRVGTGPCAQCLAAAVTARERARE
jgi:hypothetical protein